MRKNTAWYFSETTNGGEILDDTCNRQLVYGICNDAAGRGDNVALRWLRRADYKTVTNRGTNPNNFRHTGDRRMRTLDPKIGTAIMRSAKGQLGRQITQFSAHCIEAESRSPKGRELWYIVTKYFSTGNTAEAMFSLADLQLCAVNNSSKATVADLEDFLASWHMVCDTLATDLGYDCKHDMFYKAIRGCEILAHEIAHYELARTRGERDGCMYFLIDAIENKIDRERKERMRQALSSGIAREVNQIRGKVRLPLQGSSRVMRPEKV